MLQEGPGTFVIFLWRMSCNQFSKISDFYFLHFPRFKCIPVAYENFSCLSDVGDFFPDNSSISAIEYNIDYHGFMMAEVDSGSSVLDWSVVHLEFYRNSMLQMVLK